MRVTPTGERSTTVVLIDDHEMVRTALGRLLSAHEGIEVVGQGTSVAEGQKLVRELQPDVVVVDLLLNNESGAEFALDLLARNPEQGVLIVSSRLDPHEVQRLVRAGVRGYVPKSSPTEEFFTGVLAIGQGRRHFSPEAASALAASMIRGAQDGPQPLTNRQLAVLRRMARGMTTKQIADDICLSPKTVEKYRSDILRRFGCKNQVQALEAARKLHLLDEE